MKQFTEGVNYSRRYQIIRVRRDNNSLVIECSEMRKLDDDHVSEEVVQSLRMARNMSSSTLKLE